MHSIDLITVLSDDPFSIMSSMLILLIDISIHSEYSEYIIE